MIVGDLDVGEFPGLAPYVSQMEILPLRHWSELPATMATIDVNLIPLELTPFNEGKSNLKYYEAGLLKVPSIASPTRINRENIAHGHNGLLAQTTAEWYEALKELATDGAAARGWDSRHSSMFCGLMLPWRRPPKRWQLIGKSSTAIDPDAVSLKSLASRLPRDRRWRLDETALAG